MTTTLKTVAPTVEQVMAQIEIDYLIKRLGDREAFVSQGPRYLLQSCEMARSAVVELRSLVEALAVDAERYRWLRDRSEPGICTFYLSVGQAFRGVKFKPETVDAAIDAARTPITTQSELPGSEGV